MQRLDLAFDIPYWVGVKADGKEEIWPLMAGGYPMPAINTGPTAEAWAGPQVVLANEVLSANINEADNLSGQNTNTGSGIKTGHIANNAVTSAKIANGTIATVDIKNGAVTDVKITGPISSAKIQQGTSTVDAVITALTNRIAALEAKLVNLTTSPDGHDMFITGANLHVRSGSGATDGLINGLGNIIIGYNELRPILIGDVNDRTGSHNLVVGTEHNFSSFGGMAVGRRNTISGGYASVSGGADNIASGLDSSVSGGSGNAASGSYSSVSGGSGNDASGGTSSVSGGRGNVASSFDSSVSGGWENTASGSASSVSGGRNNEASGLSSTVAGGGSTVVATGNKAFADYSAILGGTNNKAGDPALLSHTIGQFSTVGGGTTNVASGTGASVSGGTHNTASGATASVSGGSTNTASGGNASVNGGLSNAAGGSYSTVSGGASRSAAGSWNWAAGTLFQAQ